MGHGLMQYGVTILGQRISYAEIVGQLAALAVVFAAQRRTLWTWPIQVVATVLLFVVYTSSDLGGLAARQVVILAISVYGWWSWSRRRDPVYGVVVRTATWRERALIAATLAAGTVGVAILLDVLNASWAPWPDAWIFVGTLVAFAGQGLGLVEFWLVWLAVDAVGVPLQIQSHLYFSAAVYLVFTVLVLIGVRDWLRTARRDAARRVADRANA